MTEQFRVGTRGSPLALVQTEWTVQQLRRAHPRAQYEVVPLRTAGDRTVRSAESLDFTDAIDRALEAREVDLAVHSAKDLPARPVRAVRVGAFPPRGDPRDCAILRRASCLRELPRGARIGSSSVRRRAQLLALRPDLNVVPLRGNVGTRLERIRTLGLDGVILAAAGVTRLGGADRITELLPAHRWLPAPAQGALAVEVRTADRAAFRHVHAIDDPLTRAAVESERAVVAALGGDCNLPLGAWSRPVGGRLRLRAAWFSGDGTRRAEADRIGPIDGARELGRAVGRQLRAAGPALGLTAGSPAPVA